MSGRIQLPGPAKGSLPYFVAPNGTDDSAALMAAHATGRQVWLTAGNFKINEVALPAYAALAGSGKNLTTLTMIGTGRGLVIENAPGVQLRDFTVDGNKANTVDGGTSSGQQCIYIHASNSTGCPGVQLTDVRAKNSWYRGIYANADTQGTNPLDVELVRVHSHDNGDNALGTGANGFRATNCQRAVVRGGYFARNGGYGIHVINALSAAADGVYVDDHQNNHGIVMNNGTLDLSVTNCQVFRSRRVDYPIGSGAATFTGATDTVTTPAAHRMPVNTPVRFGTVTGTTGIVAGTIYYVKTVPTPTTFTLAASTAVGAPTIDLVGDGTGTGLLRPSSGQTQWGIVAGIDAAKMIVTGNMCDGNEGGITIDVAELVDPTVFVQVEGVVANNDTIHCTRSNAGMNINHVDGLVVTGNNSSYNLYSGCSGYSITARNIFFQGNSGHHNGKRGVEFLEANNAGPHLYGTNDMRDNNQSGGAWTDFYSEVLLGGPVKSTFAGITASTETTTTISNTATETTVVSLATGVNPTPQAGDRLVLRFNGETFNNTGAAVTVAFRIKIGTTSVALSGNLSLSASATQTRPFSGEVVIALAAINSQIVSGHMIGFQTTSAGAFTLGLAGGYGAIKGTAAEDLSTSKNVIVQATMGTANALASVSIFSASLERIPKR